MKRGRRSWRSRWQLKSSSPSRRTLALVLERLLLLQRGRCALYKTVYMYHIWSPPLSCAIHHSNINVWLQDAKITDPAKAVKAAATAKRKVRFCPYHIKPYCGAKRFSLPRIWSDPPMNLTYASYISTPTFRKRTIVCSSSLQQAWTTGFIIGTAPYA